LCRNMLNRHLKEKSARLREFQAFVLPEALPRRPEV